MQRYLSEWPDGTSPSGYSPLAMADDYCKRTKLGYIAVRPQGKPGRAYLPGSPSGNLTT